MLKVLLKQKELREAQDELKKYQDEAAGFEAREAELAKDIDDAVSDEERSAVETAVAEFDATREENKKKIGELETKIRGIEAEIDELEKNQEDPEPEKDPEPVKRSEEKHMNTRKLFGMDAAETRAFVEREDVKAFLTEIRSAMREKRAISNAALTIPEVIVGLIRENIERYSKVIKYVNLRQVSGDARELVEGTIPEAVWTDCCANVNELGFGFNDAEVYCWGVGGYIPVCKATLQDSDVDLAGAIIEVLGASIGFALDKAMIFGLGTRMPQGVFTRLKQTSKPADYSATERTWVDLHSTNIKTISNDNSVGVKLFQNILDAAKNAKGKYSARGQKVWFMNDNTKTELEIQALSVNAAGAIVTGINGTMPVAGGPIETLEFIPDNMIIVGFFDTYLLAAREGIVFEQSDHAMFLNRKRVYMANARYDGKPVIAEAFAAIGIKNTTPSDASIVFAPDTANTPVSQ